MKHVRLFAVCLAILLLVGTAAYGQNLVGEKAKAIDAESWLNAEQVSLDQFKGRTVVLYFWTSWNPVCKGIVPEINALCEVLKARQAELIGLTSERSRDRLAAFVTDNAITFPVGLGSQAEYKYNIASIPYFVLIGPDGTVQWDGADIAALRSAVEGAAPAAAGGEPPAEEAAAAPDAETPVAADAPVDDGVAEVLVFLKEADKETRNVLKDAAASTEFLASIRGRVTLYATDRKVVSAAVKTVAKFLTGTPDIDVRIEAARLMGIFTDDRSALANLLKVLTVFAKKGLEYNPLQVALIESIALVGRFDAAAAKGLFTVLENTYDAHEDVKRAALTAYGDIRTYDSCDCLVKAIAKLAPDPEDPWDSWGDDAKGGRWNAVADALYDSLEKLTGQSQGTGQRTAGIAGFGSFRRHSAWGYSQWKRWIQDNKAFLVKKFAKEQEEVAK